MSGPWLVVFWGALAASSLLIGAALVYLARSSDRVVGLVLAFGAGTLISAVAYELVPTETEAPLGVGVAIGLLSAHEDRFVPMTTMFERPAPLSIDWPSGEFR